jgi:hypothetical protein
MILRRGRGPALALAVWLAAFPTYASGPAVVQAREVTILQIRTLEGDSAVFGARARTLRPLTVQITDETGKPVQGAVVHFRLPPEGPSGVFSSGLTTALFVTGADGRADAGEIRWGAIEGALQIRVTAALGEIRAGALIPQFLLPHPAAPAQAGSPASTERPSAAGRKRSASKWIVLTSLVAGAAVGGLAAGLTGGGSSPPAVGPAIGAVQLPPQPAITIGAPSISVGAP